MAKYRQALSQIRGDFFLTDGGIETTLIFLDGQDYSAVSNTGYSEPKVTVVPYKGGNPVSFGAQVQHTGAGSSLAK